MISINVQIMTKMKQKVKVRVKTKVETAPDYPAVTTEYLVQYAIYKYVPIWRTLKNFNRRPNAVRFANSLTPYKISRILRFKKRLSKAISNKRDLLNE